MYQRVFFGDIKQDVNRGLPDLSGREKIALWPTAVAALAMGVMPLIWLNPIEPAVRRVLAPVSQMMSQVIGR
jgi:NADH-quinone oxidoreductase subunit M